MEMRAAGRLRLDRRRPYYLEEISEIMNGNLNGAFIPVCILTKQSHTLKTALSTKPAMKVHMMRTMSLHDCDTFCLKCSRIADNLLSLSCSMSSNVLMA